MKKLTLVLMIAAFLASCSSDSSDKGASTESIASEITRLETEYGADPGNARSKIMPLLAKYEEYIDLKDGDAKKKVDYLLRAGEMAALVTQFDKSLGYYDRILKEFPESEKVATALFMKGYTMDDKLKRLDEAKAIYEEFLKKYPEDGFADDTKFLLDNLGKSEEEIIKQFEGQ